jgi:hypothetical protein
MKLVINRCYGGFHLSEKAYEQLIAWGVPVRKHIEQQRDPKTNLFLPEPANDGEVIFDRELTPPEESTFSALYHKYKPNSVGGRYWDTWTDGNRSHPLVVRVVEELGAEASAKVADLKVVDIPDGTEYEINEYDGMEHVAELHRIWR